MARRSKRVQKQKLSLKFIAIILVLLIIAFVVVLWMYDFNFNKLYNDIFKPDTITDTSGDGSGDEQDGTTGDGSGNQGETPEEGTASSSSSTNAPSGEEKVVDTFKDLKVHFIDVGQGDCILIEFPDDKVMMVDTGDNTNADGVKNEIVISNYLSDLNITTIDYLLLTHQDSDHSANIDFVLDTYDVKYIFKPNTLSAYDKTQTVNGKEYSLSDLPEHINTGYTTEDGGRTSTTATYFRFLLYSYLENCPVEVFNKDSDFGNSIVVNDEKFTYTLDFLTPTANREDIKYKGSSSAIGYNAYSPIIVLEYCGTRLMLTGDANEVTEEEFCEKYPQGIDVDILKFGHHGSDGSGSAEFLSLIDPEVSVILCGEGNKHDHPRQAALDRLVDAGVTSVYRSDTNGHIVLTISKDGYTFDLEVEDVSNNFIGLETILFDNTFNGEQIIISSNYNEGYTRRETYLVA